MKRRSFIVSAAGAGVSACSGFGKKVKLEKKLPPFSFGDNYPKPEGGSIPRKKLWTTDIEISTFGFGSHMRSYLRPYEKERERMLRDAFEYGVNLYDVYDVEGGVYQYEPTGRHLSPVINDCVISITIRPYDGRTLEQEFERDLRVFGKDHIDMVRLHAWAPDDKKFGHEWDYWETLFKWKEQGKIRAVGVPIHSRYDVEKVMAAFPIDYVIFPYNFHHNIAFAAVNKGRTTVDGGFDDLAATLRKRGIGVVTMKTFAGDNYVTPFKDLAAKINPDVNFPQAALRYVINSGLNPDSTVAGMYYPSHVYENIEAYLKPEMNDDERKLLKKLRSAARLSWQDWTNDYYRFLNDWAPDSPDDSDLVGRV